MNETIEMKNIGKLQKKYMNLRIINQSFYWFIEFTNLIEACKWLIEAGYAQFVHSFLSSLFTHYIYI